jgi:nucleotide-binding universal stress UspA family protein
MGSASAARSTVLRPFPAAGKTAILGVVGRIVVGVDGSEHGRRALLWAHHEAGLRGDELTAVLAWGLFDQLHAGGGASFDPDYGPADAAAALDATIAGAIGDDAAAEVRQEVVCDLPARALLDAARDADLLVVGPRGRGELRELMLGSVSQACLHHARCPVGIVRTADDHAAPKPAGADERVVVGVDGSDDSARALRWALVEARVRGAGAAVVHAWHPPYSLSFAAAAVDFPAFENAASRLLDRLVDAVEPEFRDVTVERVLVAGSPTDALLGAAEDAVVVVVGGRGVGGFRGLLLGSVSQQLAHHAPCPVVVVPSAAARSAHVPRGRAGRRLPG